MENANVYSDIWLRQRDIKMDLTNQFDKSNLNATTLLRILNAVKKIINIVHGNNRYKVIFDGQEESGYINYSTKRIVLSAKLLKHPIPDYSTYDIIDILTGTALHESGHAEYSEKDKRKRSELTRNVTRQMHNILEDAVIERIMSNEFPGYEAYFFKLRNHYFKRNKIEPTDDIKMDKMNEFLIGVRYVGDTILNHSSAQECVNRVNEILLLPNKELIKFDRIKFTNELFEILFSKTDIEQNQIESISFNGLSDLGGLGGKVIFTEIEDNEEEPEYIDEDLDEDEDIEEEYNEEDRDKDKDIPIAIPLDDSETILIKRGHDSEGKTQSDINDNANQADVEYEDKDSWDLDDNDIAGALKEFLDEVVEEEDDKLNDHEVTEISSLEQEEHTELLEETVNNRKFYVNTCKPVIIDMNRDQYKWMLGNVKKHIITFRNKFSWANTAYNVNAYGLQSGSLDDDNLYSAKFNRNIFMDNTTSTSGRTQDIDISFVMDFSGSMDSYITYSKRRYEAAQELAILFSEALEPIRSINSWVFAFQEAEAYQGKKNNMAIKNLSWEEKQRQYSTTQLINLYSPTNKNKYAITTTKPEGYTPEYEALHGTMDMLKKFGKKNSKKIIVMMTDGGPYSNSFESSEQMSLLSQKIKECEKKGISVIHLALTDEADKTPYPNKVRWESKLGYDGLIDGFVKMLNKIIK